MRTTVTLDPDVEVLVRRRMAQRRVSFKQAINDAVRDAYRTEQPGPDFRTRAVSMGEPVVSLDRALQIAGELEDDELVRRMQTGS